MAVQWTAGAVEPTDDTDDPPSPATWEPVGVPGRPSEFAGAEAVAYRARFADPRSDPSQRAMLDLEGAYAHARVWVDGEYLGRHDAYWRPAAFEFDPSPETELIVECRTPDDRFGGIHGTEAVPEELSVPGIWWGVGVRVRPATFLADLTVAPRLADGEATIDAAVTVDAAEAVDDSVTLSLRPDGFRGGGTMERMRVTAPAGERTTVTHSIAVRDPSLWWPRDHGDQHRYTVRAKLGDDAVARTTGLSRVEYEDGDLHVNGRPVAARGFNLTPGPGDPTDDVERAAAANATLVRAHGHVPRPPVHEAADEAGLLVWQDLPLVGPGSFDVERGREVASGVESALRRHPSAGLYSVHTGPTAPFSGELGDGFLDRLRLRWRAWRTDYDRSDADAVAETLSDRGTVPVVGGLGVSPDAADLFPGWDYGEAGDVTWLLEQYPDLGRAVGAFGAGALADGATAVDDAVDFDPAVHETRVGDADADRSQRYQARTLATVAEALRRRGCSLLAAFCLRDARPAGGMGVVAADGDPKAAYDRLRTAYAPTVGLLDDVPDRAEGVVVRNDRPETVEAAVKWEAGDAAGSDRVTAPPGETAPVEAASVPSDAETVEIRVSVDGDTVTNRYDRE